MPQPVLKQARIVYVLQGQIEARRGDESQVRFIAQGGAVPHGCRLRSGSLIAFTPCTGRRVNTPSCSRNCAAGSRLEITSSVFKSILTRALFTLRNTWSSSPGCAGNCHRIIASASPV